MLLLFVWDTHRVYHMSGYVVMCDLPGISSGSIQLHSGGLLVENYPFIAHTDLFGLGEETTLVPNCLFYIT